MPNLTSLMAWSFRLTAISRLSVVDRCTFRRGVTIQTFEKQGSDSEIRPPSSRKGMRVRREARLVDDHR